MSEPVIAQKYPYAVDVDAGQELLVVRLRQEHDAAILRRQP